MSPQEKPTPVSDLRLERYRLGELPAGECKAIAARMATDPALAERLARLQASDRQIEAEHPAEEMVASIRRRSRHVAAEPRAARARPWLVPAALATACVTVLAVAAGVWLRQPIAEDTTIKGGGQPSLVIHRKVGDGSEELSAGAVVRQGDQVRIGYRASGRAHGTILSIDGRGSLTQHLPRTGERAGTLQASGTLFLDFAYELDDAPRWEVFYFVTSDAPFDIEPIRQAIRDVAGDRPPAALRLPGHFQQFVFPLGKDDR